MKTSSRTRIAIATTAVVLLSAHTTPAFPAPASEQARRAAAPQDLADQLAANDRELRAAIDSWLTVAGDPPGRQAPEEVIEPALLLQRKVLFMARHPNAAGATIGLLSEALAKQVGELTEAARKLRRLAGDAPPRQLRIGKPRPLAELVGYYGAAERRYGIEDSYLAAINLVETKFGRVKSDSVSGAKGPMQFLPSTWRIYGRGGDIHDPHDAILAAARLLRDAGAPSSYARALHAYNPSKLYVQAVTLYARVLARDPYAIRFLYCWGP